MHRFNLYPLKVLGQEEGEIPDIIAVLLQPWLHHKGCYSQEDMIGPRPL